MEDVENAYGIKAWGKGYFSVNADGNVAVTLGKTQGDLYTLVQSLVKQGIDAPVLIRFDGIIKDRIDRLANAFQEAIRTFNYGNSHQMAYPIKVNPQRHVVEIVQQVGKQHAVGLEVGSKPELLSVLALENHAEELLLCNGYKDAEYIALALMAGKLGRKTYIIIEQLYELKLVLQVAAELNTEAQLGFRMKLSHEGSGRWKTSGGEHSKFGLFAHEIASCSNELKKAGKTDWLKLLHFHMGSQITSINSIKHAVTEAACMYTELAKEHPSLYCLDVGGGLAVDYDGTNSLSDSSMNYSEAEYARDIVSIIGETCAKRGISDPLIITEAGRALVAHHSVMIVEVIDVASYSDGEGDVEACKDHELVSYLLQMLGSISQDNCREYFHDVMEIRRTLVESFIHGQINLQQRAAVEILCRRLLESIRQHYRLLPEVPEEISVLDSILLETYFCNFSVFQSLPDSWAVGQLFPVMPIHNLFTKPTHQAKLADLSCDSDGKISSFIGKKGPEDYLSLNTFTSEPYYIGIFLVGAYQEILGGLHNLFGDTNVVHAEVATDGKWTLSRLVEGDTIEEVLGYVQYNTEQLKTRLQDVIEERLKADKITLAEAAEIKKNFKKSLESYTYLLV